MAPTDPLLVVTTRSRLKGPWLFPKMMAASLRIRRQLATSHGCVRWASVVASPTEFWTVTVWKTRHDMQEFMRSGAHDEIMWEFSKWLDSFWLMRWRPEELEAGSWDGITLAPPAKPPMSARDEERLAKLDQALDHLPRLRESMAPDGTACYESSLYARRRRSEVSEACGLAVHIHASPLATARAWHDLRTPRRRAGTDPQFLRAALGFGRPGDVYLLMLWSDRQGAVRVLADPLAQKLAQRWKGGWWANQWSPENEFGHWDGVRVRRTRRRHGLTVPEAAMAASEPGPA